MVVQFPPPWKAEFPHVYSVGILAEKGGQFHLLPPVSKPLRSASGEVLLWSPAKDGKGIECIQKGIRENTWVRLGKTVSWKEWTFAPVSLRQDSSGTWLYGQEGYLCRSPAMLSILLRSMQFAGSPAPVHLFGESGSGKEGLAALIHRSSEQRDGPFVPVNCGALHSTLGHGELFGRERGSYTGATHAAPGLLEQAHGGTLFLDEVGELSPDDQSRLLRVLETGRFRRIGSNREREIQLRIVSATHKNLEQAVAAGSFRADLYYRLCVFQLDLPPLRNRTDDLPHLVGHFLRQFGHSGEVAQSAMGRLKDHVWLGNIRELRNVLMQAALLAGTSPVENHHLQIREAFQSAGNFREIRNLQGHRDQHIRDELIRNQGNRKQTCRNLAISRSTLYRWIRDHPNWQQKKSPVAAWTSVDTPPHSGDDGASFISGVRTRGTVPVQPIPG